MYMKIFNYTQMNENLGVRGVKGVRGVRGVKYSAGQTMANASKL